MAAKGTELKQNLLHGKKAKIQEAEHRNASEKKEKNLLKLS